MTLTPFNNSMPSHVYGKRNFILCKSHWYKRRASFIFTLVLAIASIADVVIVYLFEVSICYRAKAQPR